MTPARSFLIAMVAGMLLVGGRLTAGDEQYPRGLMSAAPTAGNSNRTCTIETRPVSFGTYDALSTADVDAVGQVIYTCGNFGVSATAPPAKAIRIEMDTGLANTFERSMVTSADAIEHLLYNLYLDPTHRTIWGNGFYGTDVYIDDHPPNRTPVIVPIYGRIHGNQNVVAGQYFDTLLARVVF